MSAAKNSNLCFFLICNKYSGYYILNTEFKNYSPRVISQFKNGMSSRKALTTSVSQLT